MALLGRMLKWVVLGVALILATVFAVRAIDAFRGAPLQLWHEYVPDDATAETIDTMSWADWKAAEDRVMTAVEREVSARLPEADRVPQNRYWSGSPMHPSRLRVNWNLSSVSVADGPPRGVVVLLHGLTDAPYSLRHIGELYRARGFAVVAPRMPGHGTVPGGLTKATVEDWQAATRLAVREARRLAGPDVPLHLVGYSNGGALALRHQLAAARDPALGRASQIVLISPMIGLTPFSRFSGLVGWPAVVPAFAPAAWLDTIPEYNPFKYNSFPVKAAVEAHALTVALGEDLRSAEAAGHLAKLPPVLTFQSVVDSTVSSRAVVTDLYDRLGTGGHELVLFDINRAAKVGPLMRGSALQAASRLISAAERPWRLSLVTNVAPGDPAVQLRSVAPGSLAEEQIPLGLSYPPAFHSLGHIALPFPLSDGLYGFEPDPADAQGVELGALAVRGENNTLSVGMGMLTRASSNPFFRWMLERIGATIPADAAE